MILLWSCSGLPDVLALAPELLRGIQRQGAMQRTKLEAKKTAQAIHRAGYQDPKPKARIEGARLVCSYHVLCSHDKYKLGVPYEECSLELGSCTYLDPLGVIEPNTTPSTPPPSKTQVRPILDPRPSNYPPLDYKYHQIRTIRF